jgi:hypothetical protein
VFWTIDAMKYFKTNLPDTFTRKESFDFLIGIIRMTEFTLPISTSRRKRGFGLVDRDVHWTRQQGQRGDGIRLQLQDSRRHSRSDKKAYGMYIFDFESSSMWMILIRD